MAWLTLVMPSEAARVSHKVHSIISSAEEFNSVFSEVMCMWVNVGWEEMIHFRLYSRCFIFVSRKAGKLLNLAFCAA